MAKKDVVVLFLKKHACHKSLFWFLSRGGGGGGSITQPSSSGILLACVLAASKLTFVKRILCLEKYKAA